MSTMNQPELAVVITPNASAEVKKFMEQEGVDPAKGGLRVSVQPGPLWHRGRAQPGPLHTPQDCRYRCRPGDLEVERP